MGVIPRSYLWLASLGVSAPKMIQEALKLYGTEEFVGTKDNPVILQWAKELNLGSLYLHDSTAWCGLFMSIVAKRAGKRLPPGPLWARNWRLFGTTAGRPSLGDSLVFSRGVGGHVGLYVGEDDESFHVLGGNQGDTVSIVSINKDRLLACRTPEYKSRPVTAVPFHLSPTGAWSTDES